MLVEYPCCIGMVPFVNGLPRIPLAFSMKVKWPKVTFGVRDNPPTSGSVAPRMTTALIAPHCEIVGHLHLAVAWKSHGIKLPLSLARCLRLQRFRRIGDT